MYLKKTTSTDLNNTKQPKQIVQKQNSVLLLKTKTL